jgi:hypothetical protein
MHKQDIKRLKNEFELSHGSRQVEMESRAVAAGCGLEEVMAAWLRWCEEVVARRAEVHERGHWDAERG